MRLSNLAGELRSRGFTVVEHPGWSTRGYRGRDLDAVNGVVWHHTATRDSIPGDYPTARYIISGHPNSPLSQLGLGREGTVHLLAAGLANHAGRGDARGLKGNRDTIGVEMESGGVGYWTAEQRLVMPRLARALTEVYAIPPDHHISHEEWATPRGRKNDPVGVNMAALRTAAATPPETPKQEEDIVASREEVQADIRAILREEFGVGGSLQIRARADVLEQVNKSRAAVLQRLEGVERVVVGLGNGLDTEAIIAELRRLSDEIAARGESA